MGGISKLVPVEWQFLVDLMELYIFVSCLAILLVWWYTRRPKGAPPGPLGIPLLGNLTFLGDFPPKTLKKLADLYGNVYSIYLGHQMYVVLSDYETIHAAFVENRDVFNGKARDVGKRIFTDGKDLLTSEGTHWKEHRKFADGVFQNYESGNLMIEPKILSEIQNFLRFVEEKHSVAFDIYDALYTSLVNDVCILTFGKKFQYSNAEFREFKDHVVHYGKLCRTPNLPYFYPWTRKVPFLKNYLGVDEHKSSSSKIDVYVKKMVLEHNKTFKTGDNGCYVDAYLNNKEHRKSLNCTDDVFDMDSLIKTIRVLFGKGVEPTSAVLYWAFSYLIAHPDVQRRIQGEIDIVVGHERAPTFEDRIKMPYTQATITELHRKVCVVPVVMTHCTTRASDFLGFHIPERTPIIANLWAVHQDSILFCDPQTFRPERFMSASGLYTSNAHLVPFGRGEHSCVAENMASMECFLYLTSLLQRFTLHPPEGAHLTGEADKFSLLSLPKPFSLMAVKRTNFLNPKHSPESKTQQLLKNFGGLVNFSAPAAD